jgi:hypothetical protein
LIQYAVEEDFTDLQCVRSEMISYRVLA